MTTRADLRTRVYEGLADSATSPVTYATAVVDDWLDEGAEVLAEEARLIHRTVYLPVRPHHQWYTVRGLRPDVMAIWRVWHPARKVRLDCETLTALDRHHETWRQATGDPQAWAPVSADTFALYPVPASGGQLLRVDVLGWPEARVDDADRYDMGDASTEALTAYGIYLGLIGRGDTRRALDWFARFLEQAERAAGRAGLGRGGGFTRRAAH